MQETDDFPSDEEIIMVIIAARDAGMKPASVEVRPGRVIKVSESEAAEPVDKFALWEGRL